MIRDGEDEEDERWLNKYKIQRTKNAGLSDLQQDSTAELKLHIVITYMYTNMARCYQSSKVSTL